MEKDWCRVYSTTKEHKAGLIIDLLDKNNIKAVKLSEKDSSFVMFGDIDVFVNNKNEAEALELIKKFKSE
jgi:type III secretory pathway lipoprotein EscJ